MAEMLTGDPDEAPAWLKLFAQAQQPAPSSPQSVVGEISLQPGMMAEDFGLDVEWGPGGMRHTSPVMTATPPAAVPQAGQPQMGATPPTMQGMPGAVPQRDPEMDSVARAMETLTNAYARVKSGQPTDRVTEILKARSAEKPSWDEIGQAISQSFGSIVVGRPDLHVGVGEALNNIRANKILEAEKLAKVQIDDERMQNEQDRIVVQAAAEQIKTRGQIATAYKEWLENFKGVVPPETFKEIALRSATALANRPVSTPEQAYHAFAEAITGMSLPASMERTSDERFLSEYTGLRSKLRAGIPLTAEEQDRLDWIGGYRFTKVTPGTVGPQIVQPPMQPVPGQVGKVQPPITGDGKRVETTTIPGGPRVTRTEMEPTKALPKDAQDDLDAAIRTLHSVDTMRKNIQYSGIISGQIERGKIKAGIGEKGAIDFETAVKNFRVDAQSLIKGIPSNFDVETFIETLPSLGLPENVNRARIDWHSRNTHLLLALKIGYFKHLGYQIPPTVMQIAKSYGIDPDDVRALSRDEVLAKTGTMKDDAIKTTAEETRTVNGVTYYKIGGKWLKL